MKEKSYISDHLHMQSNKKMMMTLKDSFTCTKKGTIQTSNVCHLKSSCNHEVTNNFLVIKLAKWKKWSNPWSSLWKGNIQPKGLKRYWRQRKILMYEMYTLGLANNIKQGLETIEEGITYYTGEPKNYRPK